MRVIRIPLPTSIQIQLTQLQKVENKEPGDCWIHKQSQEFDVKNNPDGGNLQS
jgi:hypothetical protein